MTHVSPKGGGQILTPESSAQLRQLDRGGCVVYGIFGQSEVTCSMFAELTLRQENFGQHLSMKHLPTQQQRASSLR